MGQKFNFLTKIFFRLKMLFFADFDQNRLIFGKLTVTFPKNPKPHEMFEKS
jgi:hypothetical protein